MAVIGTSFPTKAERLWLAQIEKNPPAPYGELWRGWPLLERTTEIDGETYSEVVAQE